jgi:hypothetical protein
LPACLEPNYFASRPFAERALEKSLQTNQLDEA